MESETPYLGYSCFSSRVWGDFDGDGNEDLAQVRPAGKLLDLPPPCPSPTDPRIEDPVLDVAWASGGTATWEMSQCESACRAVGAPDLDGDENDELAVVVIQGASTEYVQFFRVSQAGPQPLVLESVPSGVDGYEPGQPLTLTQFGSVTHQGFITCDVGPDGGPLLLHTRATLDPPDSSEYRVEEVAFQLRDGFIAVSQRDWTVPANVTPDGFGHRGQPCWPT
jgi:hypothetical protein